MNHLATFDPDVHRLIDGEAQRQRDKIRLTASENYVSHAVLEASGSVLTNKYSEGYPGRRYYEGQQFIDPLETLAIERIREVFGAEHANVQPYSGSPANLAVYFAFLQPGDTVLGMALPHGGHLTHGAAVSITGRYFNVVSYGVDSVTERLDYEQIRTLARQHHPKMIIAGHSAYPRTLDFAAFRQIADEVDAILFVDMAHFAGLVAGGAHPSPVPFADVVTTTTHKTLRGPRGAAILCKRQHAQAIDKAVFPGLQGGPHNHTTAAIAVAMKEALTPEFRHYAQQTVRNAKVLADALNDRGFRLVSGGTDNHLLLIDLTTKGVGGKPAAQALDRAGLVLNYNTIPFETRKPSDPSGIRLGTPAVTSRGFGEAEMVQIAEWMERVINAPEDDAVLASVARATQTLCARFPAPGLS